MAADENDSIPKTGTELDQAFQDAENLPLEELARRVKQKGITQELIDRARAKLSKKSGDPPVS